MERAEKYKFKERSGCSLSSGIRFRPKLILNPADNNLEREADSVSEEVLQMPDTGTNAFFKPALKNQIQTSSDGHGLDNILQTQTGGGEDSHGGSHMQRYVENLKTGGSSLSSESRSFFEPRFGYDFSKVRIHSDSEAAKSAQSINALAYTSGNNIVFNQNQFSPESDSGKRLLAHELTHVVQQEGNSKNGIISRKAKECEPDRELTWADYSGSIPSGSSWAAITISGPVEADDNGKTFIQGYLDSKNSWVQEKFSKASDNSKNGCKSKITDCENYMKKNPGKSTDIKQESTGSCPASVKTNKVTVKNESECRSVYGTECKRAAVADSDLLLKHEALHFKISCELAKKGNLELTKGRDFKDVFKQVKFYMNKLNVDNGSGQGDYDEESKHRCDQAKQNVWNKKVKNGLPCLLLFEETKK